MADRLASVSGLTVFDGDEPDEVVEDVFVFDCVGVETGVAEGVITFSFLQAASSRTEANNNVEIFMCKDVNVCVNL